MRSNYLFSRSLPSFGRRDQREAGKAGSTASQGSARAVAALVINSHVTCHECCFKQPCSKLSGNEIKQPEINVSSLPHELLESRNSVSNL